MPTTKPIGPGVLYVKAESTPFTFEDFTATDALRHIGVPQLGDGFRERIELEISRGDRGVFHETLGAYNNPEFTIEIPLWGSGTAGTVVAARNAALESGAGLSEVTVGATSVTYESDSANPAGTVSMYYVDREAVLGQYLEGCIITSLGFEFDKENIPKMILAGKAARKFECYKSALGAELDGVGGTVAMTMDDDSFIRTGEEGVGALSSLPVYVKIDDEIIKVTAFNRTTLVATIEREQFSTSAATHTNGSVVSPYAEAPTYGEAGLIAGPHDWSVSDGAGRCLTKLSYTLETGRAFDPLCSGNAASNALHNEGIRGTGAMSFILDNTRNDLFTDMDQGADVDLAVTVNSVAGSIFTINLDLCRLIDGVPKNLERDSVAEVALNFRTLDTATALRGQLQMALT